MTKITRVRVLVALLIVLVLGAATVILVKNDAIPGAPRTETPGFVH